MPFKSKRQQRWMFSHEPKMASHWADETNFSHLPELKDFEDPYYYSDLKAAGRLFGSEGDQ